jgi:chromosome segregation ATPase
VQVQIGAAKARLYDEMRAERDQLRMSLEEARTQQQVVQEEAARLRAVAAQTEELRAENARLVAQIHAQAAAAESTQAELHVVKKAREAAAGAAQAALDASAAAQEASRQCKDVQHAQSVAHDALLHDMDTIEAELGRVTAQLEASQQARESMAEEVVDLRARCALQRRELEDARAALNEYDAGEDALDAALEAAARRLGATPNDDAKVTSQATSRTAAIRRRTHSALQALRRAHAAEQSASLARERLVAAEDVVSQLKAELEEARLRAQCVQQPTQTLVQNLTEARQQAAQWRSAADAAARDLFAIRDDFRLALDSRQELDASLAKALTKMAATAGSASSWVRPGRRTVPPARR